VDKTCDEFLHEALNLVYPKQGAADILAAMRVLRIGMERYPDSVNIKNLLSELLLQCGESAEALMLAENTAKVAPDSVLCQYAHGRALLALGNYAAANKVFKTASSLPISGNPKLKNDLAHLTIKSESFWYVPVVGKNISLQRIAPEHKSFLTDCRNDQVFRRQYNMFHSQAERNIDNDLRRSQQHPLDTKKIDWVVMANAKPIGLLSLVDLNVANRRAELLIGFPGKVNPWCSVEATLLALNFAFNTLKLARVYSYVYEDNPSSQRNTLHLGFVQEGVLRGHICDPADRDRRLDLFVNGMLATEFKSLSESSSLYKRFLTARDY